MKKYNKNYDENFILNQMEALKTLVGNYAFKRLLEHKAILNIWHRSSPSNWWVGNAGRHCVHLWHSEPGYKKPDLKLFENLNFDSPIIPQRGAIRFSGMGCPAHEKYALKEEYIELWKTRKNRKKYEKTGI